MSFSPSELRSAIEQGDRAAVIRALDNGADIEEADMHGEPGLPLRMACFDGHLGIVTELIRRGANVAAVSRPVMRDGRSAALGNSEDPRRAVRQQNIAAQYPLGNYGDAADGAAVAAWLLSPDARWITGETIHVNGGQRG